MVQGKERVCGAHTLSEARQGTKKCCCGWSITGYAYGESN